MRGRWIAWNLMLMCALGFALSEPAVAQTLAEADQLNAEVIRLYEAGEHDKAISLAQQVVTSFEASLGPDHEEVGRLVAFLAFLHRRQLKYVEAVPLYERALDIIEKARGLAHAEAIAALTDLAQVHRLNDRFDDAEIHLKRAIARADEASGYNERADLLAPLYTLAELYVNQRRFHEAEGLLRRAIALQERFQTSKPEDAAEVLTLLGSVFVTLGRFAEGESILKRSLALLESASGVEHVDAAHSLNWLAMVYGFQERFQEAELLHRRSLAIRERSLGSGDIKVAESINNLGEMLRLQGRYVEAEALLERSLAIRHSKLGGEHALVGQSYNNLAAVYRGQLRLDDARRLYRRSLEIRVKSSGGDSLDVAESINNLAELDLAQRRFVEAEHLQRQALVIFVREWGADHPHVFTSYSNLAFSLLPRSAVLAAEAFRESTEILKRRVERGHRSTSNAIQASEAQANAFAFVGLVKATHRFSSTERDEASQRNSEMFESAQWGVGSEAAASLAQMSARSAGGSPQLATLVRERQDLVAEWHGKDKLLIAAKSELPAKRNSATEKALSDRLAAIETRLGEIDARLTKEFPDYTALTNPKPISAADAQASLREGEALVLFLDTDDRFKPLPEETFVWVVTKTDMKWVRSDLGTGALQREVTALRCGLDPSAWADPSKWSEKTDEDRQRKQAQQARREGCIKATGVTVSDDVLPPFDAARAHKLYKGLFGEVEDMIRGKHLLVVPSGPLTQLPLQVLVTEPPSTDTALKDIAFLGARQPITVLPSAASLKSLRGDAKPSRASEPFIGFGNPVLAGNPNCGKITIPDRCPNDPAPATEAASRMLGRLVASLNTVTAYFNRSGQADVESVRKLCPLPDSAHELSCVAKSLGAGADSMVIGPAMTEPAVRRAKLERYRVLHFATHGLLAGEMSAMAKGKAEPALVFTPPKVASDEDDGLLTASEITTLKLDADWVVMSACNTAAGGASGAEALSGLAKAFFYAGARALLVSHWPVNSYAATMLTSTTFAELKRDPKIGRAEAFRRAMVSLINDKDRPWAAHPSVWAPFVVVGEGGAG